MITKNEDKKKTFGVIINQIVWSSFREDYDGIQSSCSE